MVPHRSICWKTCTGKKCADDNAGYNVFDEKGNVVYTGKNTVVKKTVTELAKEVITGKWGNGQDRKNRLIKAGYDYNTVQKRVNEMFGKIPQPSKKSIDEIAREVILGEWGNGADRKNRLTKAGYDYDVVQNRVNELMHK